MDAAFVTSANRQFCCDLFLKAIDLPRTVSIPQLQALIHGTMSEMQCNSSEYTNLGLRDLNNILLNKVRSLVLDPIPATTDDVHHTIVLSACDRLWDDATNNVFHFSVKCRPPIPSASRLQVKGVWIPGSARFASKLPFLSVVLDHWTPMNYHSSATDDNSTLGTPVVVRGMPEDWWMPVDGLITLRNRGGSADVLTITITKPNNTLLDAIQCYVRVGGVSSEPELLKQGLIKVALSDTKHVVRGDVMRFITEPGQTKHPFMHREQGHTVVDLLDDCVMIHAPHVLHEDGTWVPDMAQLKSVMDAHWGIAMNLSMQPCVVMNAHD